MGPLPDSYRRPKTVESTPYPWSIPAHQTPNGRLLSVEFEFQLKAYADSVDRRMAELLPSPDTVPYQLHQAMRYSCLAPGKRLRPALIMAGAPLPLAGRLKR